VIFLEPHPVGGDIACIAHRDAEPVRGISESIDDFEGCGFLALQAIGIDRVDQGDGIFFSRLTDDVQGAVEVAADRQNLGAIHQGLGQLSLGDVAVRNQDEGPHAPPARIGRGRGACVARARTDHGFAAILLGLADGHGHATVLEGTGRVQAVVFHIDLDPLADAVSDRWDGNQRCRPFAEGDHRC